jgi:N-acetylmuramoyl-L-alanine amidase-like protein
MAATPPTIIDHPSLYSIARDGLSVVAIVMHGTAGRNSLGYLTQNPRSVSTHYLIPRSGDTIFRMVDEVRGANHAGAITSVFTLNGTTYKSGKINKVTIGIELESMQTGRDDYTEPQLLAMGWLINDIRMRRGNIPLLRHADLDPTRRRDPVNLSRDQMEQWASAATLVFGIGAPPPPPPTIRLYEVMTPFAPLQARAPDAPIAPGVVLAPGDVIQVGDLTAGWAWISDRADTKPGIGFAPISYLRPV